MKESERMRDLYDLARDQLREKMQSASIEELLAILKDVKAYNLSTDYFLYVRDSTRQDNIERALKAAIIIFIASAIILTAAIVIVATSL